MRKSECVLLMSSARFSDRISNCQQDETNGGMKLALRYGLRPEVQLVKEHRLCGPTGWIVLHEHSAKFVGHQHIELKCEQKAFAKISVYWMLFP